VLGGPDGSFQLLLPSINRLNQTESATFLILPRWAFFRGPVFLSSIASNFQKMMKMNNKKYDQWSNGQVEYVTASQPRWGPGV
jgi:hypothetical protein